MVVRVVGLLALLLGIVFWTGNGEALVRVHILLGSLLTLALLALVYKAFRAGVATWLVAIAALWALGLPLWGLTQERIFPAGYLFVAQILHLLCAIGAIGLAEMLGAQIGKKSA